LKLETWPRVWRWGNAIACLGVVQFVTAGAWAMSRYPGGTPLDPQTVGYAFFENFVSDLGLSTSWSGRSCREGALVFNASLVVLGLATLPYFLFLPTHAPDKSELLWAGAALGVVSALALASIGLFPYDRFPRAHQAALVVWVLSLLAVTATHAWALMSSREGTGLFGLASLALTMLLAAYLVRSFEFVTAPLLGIDREAILVSIGMQKYVVLAVLAWYMLFSVRILCTIERLDPDRPNRLDAAAARYLRGVEVRRGLKHRSMRR
jgi:hypothetical membrane protein